MIERDHTDRRRKIFELVGDEGDEEATLADAGVPDEQDLEGVVVATPRTRRRTHQEPTSIDQTLP